MKVKITVTVDPDIWQFFCLNIDARQRSKVVNELLRAFVNEREIRAREESAILQEISELNLQREKILKRVEECSAELARVRAEKERKRKLYTDMSLALRRATEARSPWEDL